MVRRGGWKKELLVFGPSRGRVAQSGDLLGDRQLSQAKDINDRDQSPDRIPDW